MSGNWAVIAFIAFYLLSDSEGAAHTVGGLLGDLKGPRQLAGHVRPPPRALTCKVSGRQTAQAVEASSCSPWWPRSAPPPVAGPVRAAVAELVHFYSSLL